jgi:hypothetical protein
MRRRIQICIRIKEQNGIRIGSRIKVKRRIWIQGVEDGDRLLTSIIIYFFDRVFRSTLPHTMNIINLQVARVRAVCLKQHNSVPYQLVFLIQKSFAHPDQYPDHDLAGRSSFLKLCDFLITYYLITTGVNNVLRLVKSKKLQDKKKLTYFLLAS